ncbi:class II aldolase/adducin family protein [Blastococcus sp. TF02A-26]|uniref:class II aldolase/adducin family protein n=1 Tax=Blastococcus sp. TF02A-26 TaxID=2250577 RepID=UPI0018F29812|nr:class II aldolase/adducin family protein [Blastococcus sp. TF02A-26]
MTVTEPRPTPLPAAAADTDAGGRKLRMALPPEFTSVAEERAHRKAKLAAAFRMFSKAGLDEGVAGHITVRDPEATDTFWVNPFGMHFSMIRSSDLVRVDHAGEVVEGDRAVNGAAVAIHCAVHAARPDVVAAAHAHGPYGKTLSSLDMTIEPLTQDACAFYDDVGVFDSYSGVVLDPEEGRRIGEALGAHKAVILRNHGMLTVGASVDSAAWWFLTLERTAQSQLMAYSAAAGLGTPPRRIGHEEATVTRGQVGYEFAGWFQFQPIWERISRDQPDLFD